MNGRWSEESIDQAIAILRQHTTIRNALDDIGLALGFEVTATGLKSALARYDRAPSATFLRTVPFVPKPREAEHDTQRMPAVRFEDADQALEDPLAWMEQVASAPPPPMSEPEMSRADVTEHRLRTQVADAEAARKRLVKELSDREEQIAIYRELRAASPLPPITLADTAGKNPAQRQGVPVMLCSDWHVEEPVDPKKVNGLNEYNLAIAERCIDKMADAFEWLGHDARYDMRAGVVWLGGDLFSGYIHDELMEQNFLSPVQACLWLQERIERMLRKIGVLCPNLERIIVPCNDGNHGRNTHKIRVSTRTANSLEWMLYQNLAVRMRDDPRFEFEIADGEWTFVDVFNKTLAFTHGDSFNYGGGVGGISIPIRRGIARQFQHRKVDYFNLGHFHQRSDFGDIAVNGSMIGFAPYAQRIHAAPEPRQQSWYLIDQTRGKALSAPIWL